MHLWNCSLLREQGRFLHGTLSLVTDSRFIMSAIMYAFYKLAGLRRGTAKTAQTGLGFRLSHMSSICIEQQVIINTKWHFNSGLINYHAPPPPHPHTHTHTHLRWGGHTVFGLDPIGITISCLHNILWTSGWILTKFAWIYHKDITKNRLDFGDLDLIFKVTAVEKKNNWKFCDTFTQYLLNQWLDSY